ncbi:hypothetical protein [Opitutus sp. ER46]|uniref:hypothetical protein n=1 Tax=Opitutus sp. ER46 TaxID=2161864 RepID=UPI001304FB89|nr:hypothetical protein [Opitutus sp. ER46]
MPKPTLTALLTTLFLLVATSTAQATTPVQVATIPVAVAGRETAATLDLSPTSDLSSQEAQMLAGAISQMSGRNVSLGRVQATGSMRPYFDENSVLLLEATPFAELKVGDVVTFYDAKRKTQLVHRLVEKHGNVFYARGDHNKRMDSVYVTPETYRRRLVGVVYSKPDVSRGGIRVATSTMPVNTAGLN